MNICFPAYFYGFVAIAEVFGCILCYWLGRSVGRAMERVHQGRAP